MVRKSKTEKSKSPQDLGQDQSVSLVPYRETAYSIAREIEGWPEDHLRRWAIKAVQERSRKDLWRLMAAYLCLYGSRGASTSPNTLRSYGIGLDAILKYSIERGLDMLHPPRDAGPAWLAYLQAEGATVRFGPHAGEKKPMAPSTVSLRLTSAKLLYKSLRWARAVSTNPFENVHAPADRVAAYDKRRPYSDKSVEAMLEAANNTDEILILLAAHAGLRSAETLALRMGDINLSAREIIVQNGKGGKTRRVVLSTTLYQKLECLPRDNLDAKVIPFASDSRVRQRIKSVCERSGVVYMGYHSLRHSCGTRLIRGLSDLNDVARHLGHAKIETARVYAKWADDNLRNALADW